MKKKNKCENSPAVHFWEKNKSEIKPLFRVKNKGSLMGIKQKRSLVLRGGSWNNNDNNCRVANRNNNNPNNSNNNNGFRITNTSSSRNLYFFIRFTERAQMEVQFDVLC